MKSKKVLENKPRKQIWLEKHHILTISLVVILIVGLAIYLKYTPKYWCKQNPDKCVCEYTTTQEIQIPAKTELCDGRGGDYKFRKKTQAELDFDDCQNNPREDDLCKCEEYDEDIADLRDVEINETKAKDMNIDLEETSLSECFEFKICYIPHNICLKSRPKTEFELNPDRYSCNFWRVNFYKNYASVNHTYFYTNIALISITSQEVLNDIKSKECIQWINKTECENGNPDWVEETKCISTKEIIENYTTHELKCPEIIDNPTDIVIEYSPCSSELVEVTVYHFVKKEVCVENQTICREKIGDD